MIRYISQEVTELTHILSVESLFYKWPKYKTVIETETAWCRATVFPAPTLSFSALVLNVSEVGWTSFEPDAKPHIQPRLPSSVIDSTADSSVSGRAGEAPRGALEYYNWTNARSFYFCDYVGIYLCIYEKTHETCAHDKFK